MWYLPVMVTTHKRLDEDGVISTCVRPVYMVAADQVGSPAGLLELAVRVKFCCGRHFHPGLLVLPAPLRPLKVHAARWAASGAAATPGGTTGLRRPYRHFVQ